MAESGHGMPPESCSGSGRRGAQQITARRTNPTCCNGEAETYKTDSACVGAACPLGSKHENVGVSKLRLVDECRDLHGAAAAAAVRVIIEAARSLIVHDVVV